ncbi:MAG: hypothetical protein WDN00_05630 [Limisphaerales bacterium]
MKNIKTAVERYSYVPQSLNASDEFTPAEKLVIVYLLGTDNIILDNGEPFTHCASSLAKANSLSVKTTGRIIAKLTEKKIMKLYGRLNTAKTSYPIYQFSKNTLEITLKAKSKITIDKMAGDNINEINVQSEVEQITTDTTTDKLSDKLSDKMSTRSNITELTEVELTKVEKKEYGSDSVSRSFNSLASISDPMNPYCFSVEHKEQLRLRGFAKYQIDLQENNHCQRVAEQKRQSKPVKSGLDGLIGR